MIDSIYFMDLTTRVQYTEENGGVMTIEQAISEISSLPLDDQLKIVQTLWNQMPADAGTLLTKAQKSELDRRMEVFHKNRDSALTEEQLRQQIRDARS